MKPTKAKQKVLDLSKRNKQLSYFEVNGVRFRIIGTKKASGGWVHLIKNLDTGEIKKDDNRNPIYIEHEKIEKYLK